MLRIPISGGPSTGKTTAMEALKGIFPDAYFVPEAAERVIRREHEKSKADPYYVPVLPAGNYVNFAPLTMGETVEMMKDIPPEAELVFFDRSFVDNLGYGAYAGFYGYYPRIKEHIRTSNYSLAFFCDWLGSVVNTEVRKETNGEGLLIHQCLENAYAESGLRTITLPAVPVEDRIEIIRATIVEAVSSVNSGPAGLSR